MKYLVLVTYLIFYSVAGIAQKRIHWDSDILGNVSYAHKWKIIAGRGHLSGYVIRFDKAQGRCGTEAVAAVAMIQTRTGIVRAILPCDRTTVDSGTYVRIAIHAPPTCSISLPINQPWGAASFSEKNFVNEYDRSVHKTIFGTITKRRKINQ